MNNVSLSILVWINQEQEETIVLATSVKKTPSVYNSVACMPYKTCSIHSKTGTSYANYNRLALSISSTLQKNLKLHTDLFCM